MCNNRYFEEFANKHVLVLNKYIRAQFKIPQNINTRIIRSTGLPNYCRFKLPPLNYSLYKMLKNFVKYALNTYVIF